VSVAYLKEALAAGDTDKLIRFVRLHLGDGDEGAGRREIDKAWVEALKLLLDVPSTDRDFTPNIISTKHWDRLLGGSLYTASPRVDWATLLRRSFDVDVLRCAACGGRLRVLGEVTEPSLVRLVLETLGLPSDAPRAARARDPTELLCAQFD